VIDDTAEIRMIISESLKIYGFTTLVAEDGVSGVEMRGQHSPDLIILRYQHAEHGWLCHVDCHSDQ